MSIKTGTGQRLARVNSDKDVHINTAVTSTPAITGTNNLPMTICKCKTLTNISTVEMSSAAVLV